MARLLVINGPNLNMLSIREPHIYGSTTLRAIEASCQEFVDYLGVELAFHQSNSESAIVELIQSARGAADTIIINPAAYSFTSIAIHDALKIFEGPIVEVHISNIHARDEVAPPPQAVRRRYRGDLRPGSLRLHRCHAGGGAAGGQAPRRPAGTAQDRPALDPGACSTERAAS